MVTKYFIRQLVTYTSNQNGYHKLPSIAKVVSYLKVVSYPLSNENDYQILVKIIGY